MVQQHDWKEELESFGNELVQEERLGDLVDNLLALLTMPDVQGGKTFVGHKSPDDDVLLCFYIGKKYIPGAADVRFAFVNAGESLPGSEGNSNVIHFDTGLGEFDQHGKGIKRTSSAQILAEKLGVQNDPGLKLLLAMATAVDNVEPLSHRDIHFTIEGYRSLFRKEDGKTNWDTVIERTFELFDINYGQETRRVQSRQQLDQHARWTVFPNGLRLATILWQPQLREAAFERGASVVVWTEIRHRHKDTGEALSWPQFNRIKRAPGFSQKDWEQVFYTGIQRNRRPPGLYLDTVALDLTKSEAKKRNAGLDLLPRVWFLHESKALILNGSLTHDPKREEITQLTPTEIVGTVEKTLSRIPSHITSQWGIKNAPR